MSETTLHPARSGVSAYDVFNGDADGICALHQLRLAVPVDAVLVTGVKREVQLLKRFESVAGDLITVLDIALDANLDALKQHLANGAVISYFDHHTAKMAFEHPRLAFHWDDAVDVCSSILVNRHLQGRYASWANVAAFGDNLIETGYAMAARAGLRPGQAGLLLELGTLLNYNAYGENIDDLNWHPADLYRHLHQYEDPFDMIAESAVFGELRLAYAEDMAMLEGVQPYGERSHAAMYVLPNQAWARRISGLLANKLAHGARDKSFAVLTQKTDGNYVVSVRSADPVSKPASGFCVAFPSGGGRQSAAGINSLPAQDLVRFSRQFFSYF